MNRIEVWLSRHDDGAVTMRTICPRCGELVGATFPSDSHEHRQAFQRKFYDHPCKAKLQEDFPPSPRV